MNVKPMCRTTPPFVYGEAIRYECVKIRRWRWIDHPRMRYEHNNTKVALTRAPGGKRKKVRPKSTLRRTVEIERK